ncbi:MAG TPA: serine hydrolase [Candidatus Kryptonia bacterium]|nr:serine hydrolase [Candidatus Kryptonia bacterium]
MKRRTWLLVAALGLIVVLAIVVRRSNVWTVLTLLDADKRVANFRHFAEIFPSRPVHRSGEPFQFARAPRALDVRITYGGATRSLDEFLQRTVTTGLLVVKDDRIVYERYFLGATEDSLLTSFSMAKSFVSALVGVAIEDGRIANVDRPVTDYVPELKGSGYDGVPIKHILQMSSGVHFNEDYASWTSDVNIMFAKSFILGTPINAYPTGLRAERRSGEKFNYISVDTQVLGMLLVHATGTPLAADLEEKIWAPLGMERDAAWVTDREGSEGMEYGFCCLNATLRDYAKFGRLYLRGGDWNGRRVVPERWVRESVVPDRPDLRHSGEYFPDWTIGYQYQWWVPDGPDGEFMAIGVWGQYIYVNPRRNMVIVKTAVDPDFDDRDMENLAAFRAIAAAS